MVGGLMKYLFIAVSLLIFACADDSPFDKVTGDEVSFCFAQSDYNKMCCEEYKITCYKENNSNSYVPSWNSSTNISTNTSTNNDSWDSQTTNSSNTTSNSSLKSSKSMRLELTEYKQVSTDWDLLDNAGDPKISFDVVFYDDDGSKIRTTTIDSMFYQKDVRNWSGSITTTITAPKGTYKISVCPSVIDRDIDKDDDYSSEDCYSVSSVGYLNDYSEQEQSDYKSTDYLLYWNWYLY